jgi:hypothetical protein
LHCKRAHCVKGLVHTDHCLSIVSTASLLNSMPDSFSLDTYMYHLEHICEDFLSFAHQEGDLGFVELRLALSGNAASVTDPSTRKNALQKTKCALWTTVWTHHASHHASHASDCVMCVRVRQVRQIASGASDCVRCVRCVRWVRLRQTTSDCVRLRSAASAASAASGRVRLRPTASGRVPLPAASYCIRSHQSYALTVHWDYT